MHQVLLIHIDVGNYGQVVSTYNVHDGNYSRLRNGQITIILLTRQKATAEEQKKFVERNKGSTNDAIDEKVSCMIHFFLSATHVVFVWFLPHIFKRN